MTPDQSGERTMKCETCKGVGEVTVITGSTPENYDEENKTCSDCNGSGIQPAQSEDEKIAELSMELYFSEDNDLGNNIDHNDFTAIWENGYIKGKHINNKESLEELRFRAREIKGRDNQVIKWQKMHAEEKRRTYQAQQEIEELKTQKAWRIGEISRLLRLGEKRKLELSEKDKQRIEMDIENRAYSKHAHESYFQVAIRDKQIESMKCFIDEIIPWIGKVGSGSAIRDIYDNWNKRITNEW